MPRPGRSASAAEIAVIGMPTPKDDAQHELALPGFRHEPIGPVETVRPAGDPPLDHLLDPVGER